jgi:hypothetical protein
LAGKILAWRHERVIDHTRIGSQGTDRRKSCVDRSCNRCQQNLTSGVIGHLNLLCFFFLKIMESYQ